MDGGWLFRGGTQRAFEVGGMNPKSYLGSKTAFHVAKFIVYNSFFIISSFPCQLDAGVRHSANLEPGGLSWN